MASILQDILKEDLKKKLQSISATDISNSLSHHAVHNSSQPLFLPSTINDFYRLVGECVEDTERRQNTPKHAKVYYTQEDAKCDDSEEITFNVVRREPGQFSEGAPFEGGVRNLKPLFAGEADDPEDPNHKVLIFRYYYDNIIQFTCWARTNKAANLRALWFEDLMLEYSWYFRLHGLDKVLFWGRDSDTDKKGEEDPKRIFGRPINYFVRTEKLIAVKESVIKRLLLEYKI